MTATIVHLSEAGGGLPEAGGLPHDTLMAVSISPWMQSNLTIGAGMAARANGWWRKSPDPPKLPEIIKI